MPRVADGAGPGAAATPAAIEVPGTVWLSRLTRISASNSSAHFTNLAEARAWRPRLLTIRKCRV